MGGVTSCPTLLRFRARTITAVELALIQRLLAEHGAGGRSFVARQLCGHWDWRAPSGRFKEFAARDLLLRLEEAGWLRLPPRLRPKNNLLARAVAPVPEPLQRPLAGRLEPWPPLRVEAVAAPHDGLWVSLLAHYHYLGAPRLVGEPLKHLVFCGAQPVGALAWASAAWKIAPRDRFIGWDAATRQRHLHLLANNVRWLVLPWVRVAHLASAALAASVRRLSADWQARYGHPIYLAETFVDPQRFAGTCYRAANWIAVGATRGSAKRGHQGDGFHGRRKWIFLYPLHRHFRQRLLG